mgnify:CR=1 FL=1
MDTCPLCRSKTFFVRDPDDAYEITKFELTASGCVFEDERDPETELISGREIFCDRCSWHGIADLLQY